jgi:hypothetical protein
MQFFRCSFYTLSRFQMPLRMISADPVAKVTRFAFPNRDAMAGERVMAQESLKSKFKIMMT